MHGPSHASWCYLGGGVVDYFDLAGLGLGHHSADLPGQGDRRLSIITLMEPPVFAELKPLKTAQKASRTAF